MFIKTACCFPERITTKDYDSVLVELLDSEKVIKRKLFTRYTLHSLHGGVLVPAHLSSVKSINAYKSEV